ncbi:MAG: endolytic transglycosylase MltG [Candidatus Doudnabacteria bacterium]|nr:endolytic transglycosylase MltG [Candidatus Doudnabacteria bacterium]
MHKRLFLVIVTLFVGTMLVTAGGLYLYQRQQRAPKAVQQVPDTRVTIIEGLTVSEVAVSVERQLGIPKADFEKAAKSFDISAYSILSSKPIKSSLEGFLFPDTYLFAPSSTAEEVIERMLEAFETRFKQARGNLTPNTNGVYTIPGYESLSVNGKKGLTVYELVTLASIIERETGRDVSKGTADSRKRLDIERRTVAGIFYNRLAAGQALQSDATINYATGKQVAAPSLEDLEVKSLYNTYDHAGLPPGPISNPSLSSLEAVLNPIKTNYYYFLHKQPSGEVVYSRNFEEHVRNKNLYLK